ICSPPGTRPLCCGRGSGCGPRGNELPSASSELAGDADRRRAYGLAARVAVSRRSWAAVGDELIGHYHAVRAVSATVGLPAAS
ncbi:hypothetical protein ABZ749_15035, partial [Micromonospora sp. NPDC047753]